MKTVLRDFQKEGVRFISGTNGRMILGDDMGLGKTIQTLAWCDGGGCRAIVVCPASVKYTWEMEISQHTDAKCLIFDRKSKIKQLSDLPEDIKYVIISYNVLLTWLVTKTPIKAKTGRILRYSYDASANFSALKFYGFNMLILDESHYTKNYKATRTRCAIELASKTQHMLLLSGTAIKNRPSELWTQLHMIDPKMWNSFFNYGVRYCGGKRTRFGWDFDGATNIEELHRRIQPIYLRRCKQDVLSELPDKSRQALYYDMYDSGLVTTYRSLIKQIEELDELRHMLSKLSELKCTLAQLMTPNTDEFIADVLESTTSKIIVFTAYIKPLTDLYNKYADIAVAYHGELSTEEKGEVQNEFTHNPNRRLFIATIRSAGVGLNLQVADKVIFNDVEWSPADIYQAEDRAWRIGQKNNVNVYYMGFKNTYHEIIYSSIISKTKVMTQLLDGRASGDDILNTVIKSIKKDRIKNG